MMLTPLQLSSVHHNLPVTDVHVMLKKIGCESRVWSTKRSQGKTERHLNLSIKYGNTKYKLPLIVSRMK